MTSNRVKRGECAPAPERLAPREAGATPVPRVHRLAAEQTREQAELEAARVENHAVALRGRPAMAVCPVGPTTVANPARAEPPVASSREVREVRVAAKATRAAEVKGATLSRRIPARA
jgi:hypothetical protein